MSLNIAPHIPQVVANASAPTTEALANSNAIKETIPAPSKTEASASLKPREQDTRAPTFDNVTYDRAPSLSNKVILEDPQQEQRDGSSQQQKDQQQGEPKGQQAQPDETRADETRGEQPEVKQGSDNAGDASQVKQEGSGSDKTEKSNADKAAEQKQQEQERAQIRELSARDTEVRNHELAHAAVGGSYAGAPTYEYQTGPDGKKYAVGGEVSIDVSEASTPQETIEKMQTVRAAALAPAEPSAQDRKVAAEASQNIAEARVEMVQESEEQRQAVAESVRTSFESVNVDSQVVKTAEVVAQRYGSSYVTNQSQTREYIAVA